MTRFPAFAATAALLLTPVAGVFMASPAEASGATPKYRAYCEAKYRTGPLRGAKPSWSYRYNERTKRMECKEKDSMGLGTTVRGRSFWINLNDLCQFSTGRPDFHWHGEGRVACGPDNHR